jgi:hypothetical protein
MHRLYAHSSRHLLAPHQSCRIAYIVFQYRRSSCIIDIPRNSLVAPAKAPDINTVVVSVISTATSAYAASNIIVYDAAIICATVVVTTESAIFTAVFAPPIACTDTADVVSSDTAARVHTAPIDSASVVVTLLNIVAIIATSPTGKVIATIVIASGDKAAAVTAAIAASLQVAACIAFYATAAGPAIGNGWKSMKVGMTGSQPRLECITYTSRRLRRCH